MGDHTIAAPCTKAEGGENIAEIAEDFVLDRCHVVAALKFEAIDVDIDRQPLWPH